MKQTFTLFDLLNSRNDLISEEDFIALADHETKDITCKPGADVIDFIINYSNAIEFIDAGQTGEFGVIHN